MDLITVYQIEFKSLTVAELLIYVAIGVLVKVLIRTSGPVVLHEGTTRPLIIIHIMTQAGSTSSTES